MGLMQLLVRLGLDATGYETGLKKAQSSARSFGHELSSAVGGKIASVFGVAAIEESIRKTIEWGHKLSDMSLRTGIPVEELQKLEYAADMTGSSLESVVKAVEKFAKSQAAARKEGPGGDKFEAMKRMGLSDQDISNGAFVANFYKAAAHMKETEESAQLVADWTSIAGKNAMELAPAMREGLDQFASEMERMGAVVPVDEMAKLAEAAEDFHRIMVGIRVLLAKGVGNKGAGFLDEIAIAEIGATEFVKTLATTGSLPKAHKASKEIEAEAHEALASKHDELVEKLKGERLGGEHDKAESGADKSTKAKEKAELKELMRIHERVEEIRRRTGLRAMTDAERLKEIETEIAAVSGQHARELAAARAEAAKAENAIVAAKTRAFVDSRATPASPDEIRQLEIAAANAKKKVADLEHGLSAGKQDLKMAELEDQRQNLLAKKDKGFDVLRGAHDSLLDVGNYLGMDPNRGVVDKLDVINTNLREIATNTKPHPGGSEYPSS